RQRERDAFVPQNYWLVSAQLLGRSEPSFETSLASIDGTPLEKVGSRLAATSEPQAARCKNDLEKATYRVASVKKRETKRKAPAPHAPSTLQQDASTRPRMAPKRTTPVAQKLYEGVTLGKGKNAEIVGLITYMRTDSVRLSADAVEECRAYVRTTFGEDA